jgi:hypothetical protein
MKPSKLLDSARAMNKFYFASLILIAAAIPSFQQMPKNMVSLVCHIKLYKNCKEVVIA